MASFNSNESILLDTPDVEDAAPPDPRLKAAALMTRLAAARSRRARRDPWKTCFASSGVGIFTQAS
ncbi:MAG: hypothetical protein QM811_11140 [Pirellulales bacterium]